MKPYIQLSAEERASLLAGLKNEFEGWKAKGLRLDMSRGKPNDDQLEFSRPMLDVVNSGSDLRSESGIQTGNYGELDGIPEAKRLMAEILDVEPSEVFVGGNSSLNLMHDLATYCLLFPLYEGGVPWGRQEGAKFLCPVPGYDRHFTVTEHLGIEMITVPMTPQGPDMDVVERMVAADASIKGMWCVPKYSNPQGITYSDETVRRLAAMEPAARDFRIFWDNAYAVHDFYEDERGELLPFLSELKKHGHEDNVFMFASTSKITFPGGGISAIGASKANIAFIKKHMFTQTIGYDKVNQLRHARFLKDIDGVRELMKRHAGIIRPKFEMVLNTLEKNLGGLEIADWEKPLGGYFLSLDTLPGCAKRTVGLCKEAGLAMTPAGATHPYGKDPEDKTIRIAPSYLSVGELEEAAGLFCLCVKLASLEALSTK